jgi:hypothetical protein
MSIASVTLPAALGLRGGADLAAMATTAVPKAGVIIANAMFAAGMPAIMVSYFFCARCRLHDYLPFARLFWRLASCFGNV